MSEPFKINIVTNYRYWTLEDLFKYDYPYLLYLVQTHRTCNKLKEEIYEFLKTK